MGLESGSFISDLDQANPITATDPVSEGSNHLRLIKKVLQQTFPNYNEAVTLTPAQLNDAALKSGDNAFSGANSFAGLSTFNGAPTFNAIATFTQQARFTNNARFESSSSWPNTSQVFLNSTNGNSATVGYGDDATYRIGFGGGVSNFEIQNAAGTPWLSMSSADGATIISGSWTINAQWTVNSTFNLAAGARCSNNVYFQGRESGGTSRTLLGITTDDVVTLGTQVLPCDFRATEVSVFAGADLVAKSLARASGSLLVYDRFGAANKVGFRAPKWRSQSVAYTVSQDDEGTIMNTSAANTVYTLPQLEAFTTGRIVNRSGGNITIVQGAGVTITSRLGGSALTGNRTIASNSIVEFSYRSATQVDLFGNGIS